MLLPPELFEMPFNPIANGNTGDRERLKADRGSVIGTIGISPVVCQYFPGPYFLLYQDIYIKKMICLKQILLISR